MERVAFLHGAVGNAALDGGGKRIAIGQIVVIRGKVHHINEVGVTGVFGVCAASTGVVGAFGDLPYLRSGDFFVRRQRFHRVFESIAYRFDFGEVDEGKRCVIVGIGVFLLKAVAGRFAKLLRRFVFGKGAEQRLIVPAAGWLNLLGGQQVVGAVPQGVSRLKVRHQAGVHAQKIHMCIRVVLLRFGESRPDFVDAKGTGGIILVADKSVDAAASVVPEDYSGIVCGELLHAVFEKIGKGALKAHVGALQLLQQHQSAIANGVAAELVAGDAVVPPFFGTAGLNHHVDVFGQRDGEHLCDVLRRRTEGALKIGAAKIDKHCTASVAFVHGLAAAAGHGAKKQHRGQQDRQ